MNRTTEHLATLVIWLTVVFSVVWADDSANTVEEQILAEFDRYAAAWNRGDLEAIAATHHPSYIHVTPDGPVALTERMSSVEDRHKDGVDQGKLSFEEMTVRPLGDDYALAYGRARLVLKDGTETTVWFTSVYLRTENGWLAIHDAG